MTLGGLCGMMRCLAVVGNKLEPVEGWPHVEELEDSEDVGAKLFCNLLVYTRPLISSIFWIMSPISFC